MFLSQNGVYFIPRPLYHSVTVISLSILLLAMVFLRQDRAEVSFPVYELANKVIVVDPGHGGCDPGASRGTYIEKEITLAVSQQLASQLTEAGAVVILLRNEDRDLVAEGFSGSIAARKREDLKSRVKKANEAGADLYVSIHTNADPSPRWSGAQVFYNKESKISKLSAVCIQDEMTKQLGNTKRKAAPGDYYILRNTEMPAVIVEAGFISNPEEGGLLVTPAYQNKLAAAVFSGIARAQIQPYDKSIEDYPGW